MIIKDFRVYHISKKLNPALPNAVYSLEYIEHVFLELDTDMYTGVGMAYTFNTVQAEAMKLLVEGYCRNLIGKDPSLIRAHWQAAQCTMGGPVCPCPLTRWWIPPCGIWWPRRRENPSISFWAPKRTDFRSTEAAGGWSLRRT